MHSAPSRTAFAEARHHADRSQFLPRTDKRAPSPVPAPPPLLQWNAVRLSQRAAEESSVPVRFFLFPRQRYPASPAQSSSPASYFPFRAIPEQRSRKKIQPAPLPVFPLERLSSALPSDHRSRSRLSFASGTSQKESSPKISVQARSPLPASSTPVLPDRQVPSPRQRPRYCLSRSLLPVPSSTMRTAKHLLLLVPRCASLCG